VTSWYNEVKKYNYNNPVFQKETGHFTQVVWKSSTKLGMGLAAGKHGRSNAHYCVAEYRPYGNYAGEFRENVLPPRSEIEIDESS
jgi:glioma pathogenesis-related protein 2